MAEKEYFQIKNESYSTIPFVRDRQDEMYLSVVKKELQEVIERSKSYSSAKERVGKVLNEVYKHQKLENKKSPESLIEFVDEALQDKFNRKDKFEYVPEKSMDLDVQVNRYSILPFVKKRQLELNEDLIIKGSKILEMSGNELVKAYISELETAKEEGRKPYRTILDAIEKRKIELVQNSKGTIGRLTSINKGVLDSREAEMLSRAKHNLQLLVFSVKGDMDYSKSSKTRESELESEISIVKFCDKTWQIKDNPVSMKKFIEKELERLAEEMSNQTEYMEFLSKKLTKEEQQEKIELDKTRQWQEKRLKEIKETAEKISKPTLESDRIKTITENAIKERQAKEDRERFGDDDIFENGGSISDRAGVSK